MKAKKQLIVASVFLILVILFTAACSYNKESLDDKVSLLHTEDIKYYKTIDSLIKFDITQADLKIKEYYNQVQENKDSLRLAHAYFYREVIDRSRNKTDSLLYLLDRALSLASHSGDRDLKARINYEYGIYYLRINNYPKSVEYFLNAGQYFEDNHEGGLAQVYNLLGTIYYRLDDLEQSSEFHQKAYEIFDKKGDTIGKAIHYGNVGKLLIQQSNYNEAKKKLKYSLRTFERLKDTVKMIKILVFLSDAELHSDNKIEALNYIDKAYDLAKDSNMNALEGHVLLHYGSIYLHSEDYEKALYYYKKGEQIATDGRLDSNTLKVMSDIYFSRGDFPEAYTYLRKHNRVTDSIAGTGVKSQIEAMRWEQKLQEREYENILLKKNQEIEQRKHLSRTRIYISLIVAALGIMLLLGLLYRNKKKSLLISKLEQKRLAEKAKAETLLKEKNREKYEYELDKKNRELVAMNIQLLSNKQLLAEVEKTVDNNTTKDVVGKELKQIIRKLDNKEKTWQQFREAFQRIHPSFFSTIETQYPQLSKTEIRICMYIKINMENNEIAALLNIEYRSLIIARSRMRKKLNLNKSEDLDALVRSW